MSAQTSNPERRQFGRRPTFQHGWVKIPGRPPITCVLRNMSEGGALLMFDQPQCLPYAFIMEVDGTGLTYGCEVRHHYGVKVGVEFVDMATILDGVRSENSYGGDVGSWIESSLPSSRNGL